MKKGFLSVISGLAAIFGAAMAQDDIVDDGVYVRLGVGATFVGDWEQDVAIGATGGATPVTLVAPQIVDNGKDVVFGAALGFDYADGIRTELEYRYAATPVEGVVNLVDDTTTVVDGLDITAHLLMANFFFDFANSSAFTPFIGGGVGGAFVENENAQRDAALALQGRAGVSLALGSGFSTDLEYIYLRTNELAFGPDIDEFVPGGPAGPAVTGDRYRSSSVMVSLRKKF